MNVPPQQAPNGPPSQQQTPTPTPQPGRQRKRPAANAAASPATPAAAAAPGAPGQVLPPAPPPPTAQSASTPAAAAAPTEDGTSTPSQPPAKKSRTNTPWTPQEELRLKQMRDAGNSWAEIAKVRTRLADRGSTTRHWLTSVTLDVPNTNRRLCKEALVQGMTSYFARNQSPPETTANLLLQDMHYAEFAEDEVTPLCRREVIKPWEQEVLTQ